LGNQQKSKSVMAYIYTDFAQARLQDDVRSRVYANDNMSADLKAGAGLTVVSLFGKTSVLTGLIRDVRLSKRPIRWPERSR
jgi:hypothetical protein